MADFLLCIEKLQIVRFNNVLLLHSSCFLGITFLFCKLIPQFLNISHLSNSLLLSTELWQVFVMVVLSRVKNSTASFGGYGLFEAQFSIFTLKVHLRDLVKFLLIYLVSVFLILCLSQLFKLS